MISNTAVPKYYGEFRDAVLRGEIAVCREVSLQMNLIDALIEDPRYYYDSNAINGAILFFEREMTLTDGSDLFLLDSFKLWLEDLFAWFEYVEINVYDPEIGKFVPKVVKRRLRNKQYLVIARGNAKTIYDSCVHSYGLNIDTTSTHQITTAPTMKQAEEVLSPIRTAIARARGPLFKFLTEGSIQNTTGSKANRQKLSPTKKGIENFLTNSLLEIKPMSIPKLQGLRTKYNTVDEWLSCDTREDVVGAIEQGASKIDDYIIVASSSEGTVRNGSGDTIKMELLKILRGEYYNPHCSIWFYKQDDISEINDPSTWVKSNPNIGKTVSYETIQRDVERAENNPAVKNDIIAKRFNIPMEGFTYFFTYAEIQPHARQIFDGMPCTMGIDLSQGNDFCAFTFLFPLSDGSFGIKTLSYITTLTLAKLPGAMRAKYQDFIDEGTLHVFDTSILDLMEVYDDLDKHIYEHEYDIRGVGYDPYNAKPFIERWEKENGSFNIEKVIQGIKTESVPLGEIKNLAESRMLIFDEDLMSYTLGNSIAIEDTNGNRKLLKRRYEEKIDNVSALLDAFVAYKCNKDMFD
ncbi:MAG: terminase [Pseudobutyrivibrio sp.]|nr:terminase [Pseudobutyrivibrio sp.]